MGMHTCKCNITARPHARTLNAFHHPTYNAWRDYLLNGDTPSQTLATDLRLQMATFDCVLLVVVCCRDLTGRTPARATQYQRGRERGGEPTIQAPASGAELLDCDFRLILVDVRFLKTWHLASMICVR